MSLISHRRSVTPDAIAGLILSVWVLCKRSRRRAVSRYDLARDCAGIVKGYRATWRTTPDIVEKPRRKIRLPALRKQDSHLTVLPARSLSRTRSPEM